MQLIAGRTAQEDNRRKNRHGAFWEDRYHATAIQAGDYLHQCVAYIDLNMMRAGVVKHPREWEHSGYREIQKPPNRYGIIDLLELNALFVGGERMAPVVVPSCWSIIECRFPSARIRAKRSSMFSKGRSSISSTAKRP